MAYETTYKHAILFLHLGVSQTRYVIMLLDNPVSKTGLVDYIFYEIGLHTDYTYVTVCMQTIFFPLFRAVLTQYSSIVCMASE